jgi:hypothetical protein
MYGGPLLADEHESVTPNPTLFQRPVFNDRATPIEVHALNLEPKVMKNYHPHYPYSARWNLDGIPDTVKTWTHDQDKAANRDVVALNLIYRWNATYLQREETPDFICADDWVLAGLMDTLHPAATLVTPETGSVCHHVVGHTVLAWLGPRRPFYPSCWMRPGQDGRAFVCSACKCMGWTAERLAGGSACTGKLDLWAPPEPARTRRRARSPADQAAADAARRAVRTRRGVKTEEDPIVVDDSD